MIDRRNFTKAVAAGAAAASLGAFSAASASAASAVTAATGAGLLTTGGGTPDFGPLRHVRTDLLDVAYVELGPPEGDTVLLYHGWPYSHYAYAEVAPELAPLSARSDFG
jgi:hypothetical protein